MKQVNSIVFCLMTLLASCGKESANQEDQSSNVQLTASTSSAKSKQQPCDLLTKEMLVAVFHISAEDLNSPVSEELLSSRYQGKAFQTLSCDYEWAEGSYSAGLSINVGEAYEVIPDMATKSFENTINLLKKGVTSTTEQHGKEYSLTFKGTFEPVAGIGERAAFRRTKGTALPDILMFVSNNVFYTLHVGIHPNGYSKPKEDPAKVLDYAKQLAQKIIDQN